MSELSSCALKKSFLQQHGSSCDVGGDGGGGGGSGGGGGDGVEHHDVNHDVRLLQMVSVHETRRCHGLMITTCKSSFSRVPEKKDTRLHLTLFAATGEVCQLKGLHAQQVGICVTKLNLEHYMGLWSSSDFWLQLSRRYMNPPCVMPKLVTVAHCLFL